MSDEPVTLDYDHTPLTELASMGHVHDLDGTCMKRRLGPLCEPVAPASDSRIVRVLEEIRDELRKANEIQVAINTPVVWNYTPEPTEFYRWGDGRISPV